MILKFFEIKKINLSLNKYLLFYGKNDGLKNEEIFKLKSNYKVVERYDEKEILSDTETFFQNIFTGSLFEKEKCIIIKNATDKLINIIDDLFEKKVNDILFIFISENLDKKSKLRKKFETEKNLIIVPFYSDTNETLFKLVQIFFKKKNIPISSENINLIVNKCSGNRGYLYNELEKIELFSINKKNISTENLFKLISLTENFDIFELVDNCLAKNYKKTLNILNENNFSNEDSIIITRTFLNKLKKILKLAKEFEKNKDINLTISKAKPPIFWKDKEITIQQLLKWKSNEIEQLIYDINNIELLVKKTPTNHINIISDFLLQKSA